MRKIFKMESIKDKINQRESQRMQNKINCFLHFLRNHFPVKEDNEITYIYFFTPGEGKNKDDYKYLLPIFEDELKRRPQIVYKNSIDKDDKGDVIIMIPFGSPMDSETYASQIEYCKPGGRLFVYSEDSFLFFPIHKDDPDYELLEFHDEGEGTDLICSRIYSRREKKMDGF